MTDFRALCAELVDVSDNPLPPQYKADVLNRARAALAQPEPQGPTQKEAVVLYSEIMAANNCQTLGEMAEHFACAVLARWGRPAVEPVPVSDRPWEREGWCDPIGKCWWWNPATTTLGTPWWSYEPWEWMEDAAYSLPYWALPVPKQEAHNG